MNQKLKIINKLFDRNSLISTEKLYSFEKFNNHIDYNGYISRVKEDIFIQLGSGLSDMYSKDLVIDESGVLTLQLCVLDKKKLEDLINDILHEKKIGNIE